MRQLRQPRGSGTIWAMPDTPLRLLILGAHPDDAEFHAGGLATLYRRLGHEVKFVSVTNGAAGHHVLPPDELARVRRGEQAASAARIGAACDIWEFPDGSLQATLEVRGRIIREIRSFAPDLVLTHRPNDYHPDHRAVGQAVQDASYMVVVPHVEPDVPALRADPVVAYMVDLFTRPAPLRPDVVLDATDMLDETLGMLACHQSQVFQWLPYVEGAQQQVPDDENTRAAWLRDWYFAHVGPRAERFRQQLAVAYGPERATQIEAVEAFEISEYAAKADSAALERLFPQPAVVLTR